MTDTNNITLIVEPSSGILRAVWARPLLTAGLMDSYFHLLDEAVAAGCRFWHLDLRLRIWPAATFKNWLIETFAPLAVQRLGGPVHVAYWVAHSQRALAKTCFRAICSSSLPKPAFTRPFLRKSWRPGRG